MPGQSRQHFERTQWSLVMRCDEPLATDAREALVELCVRYWYPIYAYLRCAGRAPASAQEITRSFLQHLFRHFRDGGASLAQARFRHYLLARLSAFLENEQPVPLAAEVVSELIEPPSDLESRYQHDELATQSPEQAYQQSFALELLARAGARLREEAGQTGRLDMYDALQPFLATDLPPAEADEFARRFGTRSVVLAVALRRLRQRFRELIDGELADTVSSADELLAEQHALLAVLRERG